MNRLLLTEKQKDFRKEVARLNAMANKRLRRLGVSDFSSSPSYQKWLNEGGEYFSIRGKNQREVWNEYYRVKSFLESKTSTITGTKDVLKNINKYTGMGIDNVKDIQAVASDYFRLYNKVSEYVNVKGLGAIYDSNQIFNQINKVTQDLDLDYTNLDYDSLLDYVSDSIDNDYEFRHIENDDLFNYKTIE